MKNKINYLLIGAAILGICFTPINAMAENNRVNRIGGTDRYETSIEVAKKFVSDKKIDAVILANAEAESDELTGAILSKKYNAPIIPLKFSPKNSVEQIEFIKTNLSTDGTIYLLGGENIIGSGYVNEFNKLGYNNIERISGKDRYETNKKIVEKADIKEGTPVIITSSEKFADTLSMSAVSTSKQYPILITKQYDLLPSVVEQIEKIQPKEIFIAGGVEAISEVVEENIKSITSPESRDKIIRLSGKDRYETSMKVLNHFKDELNNENVFVASGRSFTNALLGATLAAQTDSPLVLTESQSIVDSKPQLDDYKSVNIIGGKFSVEVFTEQRLNNEKEFSFKATSFSEENGKKYIHGTFNKLSNDVKEIEEYARFYEFDSDIVYPEDEKPCQYSGKDIPMSTPVKIEVGDNIEIRIIDWDKIIPDNLLGNKKINIDELKNGINRGKYSIFKVEFENNKIVKITEEFRS